MDVSLTGAFVGLLIASALVWGPFFALAYQRRPFGGTARNYFLAFAGTWAATVAFFVLWTVWENL